MKRLVRFFVSLFLLTAIAACSSKQDLQPPFLHIDKKNINVGNLSKKTPVYHFKIPFRNSGGGELKILEIQPSCFCTTVDFPKEAFKRNQSGEIKVDFTTKDVSTQNGFMRELLILSNATNDSLLVTLEGNIYN